MRIFLISIALAILSTITAQPLFGTSIEFHPPRLEIVESDIPQDKFELKLISHNPKGGRMLVRWCNNNLLLKNIDSKSHVIAMQNQQYRLEPEENIIWSLCYTDFSEATSSATLTSGTIIQPLFPELITRETPWSLRGEIDGKPFLIKGSILNMHILTTQEKVTSSILRTIDKIGMKLGVGFIIAAAVQRTHKKRGVRRFLAIGVSLAFLVLISRVLLRFFGW